MNPAEQQILFFSTLLQLEKQARHAKNQTELIFSIVNETVRLVKYRQAIFWVPGFTSNPVIKAISGVDSPDRTSPFVTYTNHLLRHIAKDDAPQQWSLENIPDQLREGWQEWSLGYVFSCPLRAPNGLPVGGLLLSRDTAWQEAEISLLARLGETYAHALAALQGRRRRWGPRLLKRLPKRLLQLALLMLVILVMDLPVRLSVLAPMEIVPFKALLVTSPLASVIDQFYVQPNATVAKGEPLFSLDDTTTRNQYLVGQKELAVLEAEYHREKQNSFKEAQSRAVLFHLEATMEQKKAEIRYLAELLARSRVVAAQSGITVFGEVNEWLGKPVAVGEKILTIAEPQQVEIEIMLPVADAINLLEGAEVLAFLNITPNRPLKASLRQASYEAVVTADGILAFKLKATLAPDSPPPRIGLRGTAKIYGEQVSVFYYLMRKPLITLRQFIGI